MYRMISFLKGAAIGAGMMYFFDPVVGNRRRALLSDQINHMLHKAFYVGDAKLRDVQNRAYGTFAETRSAMRSDTPSDKVLTDRVRSEIGRHVTHPRAIEVEARNGTVFLCGPVLSSEVDELLCAVQSVRGVQNVDDRLDVHDSPGNIPALQSG
jgi:osmotically-inducible protein OsmY